MKKLATYILLTSGLACVSVSCDQKPYLCNAEPSLAIEGWIENGQSPLVMLTTTIVADGEWRSMENFAKSVVSGATVTISDGADTYQLYEREDPETGTPVYTNSMVKGEVGRTYTVTAKYEGFTIVGESTLPAPCPIIDVRSEKVTDNPDDKRYKIVISFEDDPHTKDYYKAYVKQRGVDRIYMPSLLANMDDETLYDGKPGETPALAEMSVYQDFTIPISRYQAYFMEGDIVSVRLCRMDEKTFRYWDTLEELTIFSRNIFFPTTTRIQPTVTGGEGYWCAFGSSYPLLGVRPLEHDPDDPEYNPEDPMNLPLQEHEILIGQ